jgi:dihydroxy-acid dehydratase
MAYHNQNGDTSSTSVSAGAADYDLNTPLSTTENPAFGLRSGLTSYGDAHFSLFLRKVFIKGLGFGDDACK